MRTILITVFVILAAVAALTCHSTADHHGAPASQPTEPVALVPKPAETQLHANGQLYLMTSKADMISVSESYGRKRSLTSSQIKSADNPLDVSVSNDPLELTINTAIRQKWTILLKIKPEFKNKLRNIHQELLVTWEDGSQPKFNVTVQCKDGLGKLIFGLDPKNRTHFANGGWKK